MTGEEIRTLITTDFKQARDLLEANRLFRVTTVGEGGDSNEFDFRSSADAIEFFEDQRDRVDECFLDVMTDELEFNGHSVPALAGEIATNEDQRLRSDANYVAVQQFNRAFIGGLLEPRMEKMTEQEERIARKIIAELLQTDYPL